MATTTGTPAAGRPNPVGAAIKDAGLAAFVAFILALPMLGLALGGLGFVARRRAKNAKN